MSEPAPDRRDFLLVPMLIAATVQCGLSSAIAAGVDSTMTIITPPEKISWKSAYDFPPGSAEQAELSGAISEPGPYFILVRWHPGFMSAPHWYETDRLCVVVSGVWYVASGEDFAPEATVAVRAGSFVRRVAGTPHYDGVIRSAPEPAIIAITGTGPIHYHAVDPGKPGWRAV